MHNGYGTILTTLGNRPLRRQRRVAVQKRRKIEYFLRKFLYTVATPLSEQEEVAMRRLKYDDGEGAGGF
ncbi:hypothetical protein CL630_00320 [bacterium]|nr:hypothetical protein [bacterium]